MKKSAKVLAVLMVGALFVGSVSAYAAGAAEGAGRYRRAAISESENGSKAGFKKFGKMCKPAAFERAELTEEEKAAREQTMKENWKKALDERLAAGKITQEKYDQAIAKLEAGEFKLFGNGFRGPKNEMPEKEDFRGKGFGGKNGKRAELTEEEKAAKVETMKENRKKALDEQLATSKITQEKYDQAVAKLEAGEFKFFGNGLRGPKNEMPEKGEFRGKGFRGKNGKPAELTEEEKAARAETMKENWKKALDEKLAAGKITQEKYDEAVAKLEAGEFKFAGMGFKGKRWERPNKAASEQTK